MPHHQLRDWSAAYTNGAYIVGGDAWPAAWVGVAEAYRARIEAKGEARMILKQPYGPEERQHFDLFVPTTGAVKGLVVFIHGGYWLALDSSVWSHLSAGPLAHGYAVAFPTYRLCPDVRIRDIVGDIAQAITAAAGLVDGPIHLTGHSAGGHLATRMISSPSPLGDDIIARIRHTVSISGVHDLRPLLRTDMNARLKLDIEEARAESPALLDPLPGQRVTCWVGGAERGEFRRQNALLANIWYGLGAATFAVEVPDLHHFTIVDALADPASDLVTTLLS